VGCGGALIALDQGSEAAGVADYGGPWLWQRSDEGWCSREEKVLGM
jgi:hypothetical protein